MMKSATKKLACIHATETCDEMAMRLQKQSEVEATGRVRAQSLGQAHAQKAGES